MTTPVRILLGAFTLLVGCGTRSPDPDAPVLVALPPPGEACLGGDGLVVCLDDATWTDAARRCEHAGLRLAVVRDDETQDTIESLLREAGAEDSDAPWIGLRKDGPGLAWIDGAAATFVHFTEGEPNGGPGDACVHANWPPGAGSWNDARCDAVESWTSYVCQRTPS